ncbi:hypothetical protein KAF44_21530 (plasmid) [Cupriavidus necator]|nr:hypothetical protein KAF44_21530 [Cupriavidus necator]
MPVASILTMAELTSDDYMRTRGSFRTVRDGTGGTMRLPVDPTQFQAAEGSDLRGGTVCSDRDPEFLSGSAGAVRLPI